ncbi:hypothetical protein D1AOALGA4SA_2468 [Olavius algarvensis Delta 1 endosymbiont]|nr:hypothetical protein D1AOALGA4SA_2468 [Olavius algarvensis Delta 1 endosymbiont]
MVEIGKRGLRGYFFTYEQYQELKKVADFNDAKKKIAQFGYPSVMEAESAKEIIDTIQQEVNLQDRKGCLSMAIMEMIFWTAISLFTCS